MKNFFKSVYRHYDYPTFWEDIGGFGWPAYTCGNSFICGFGYYMKYIGDKIINKYKIR